MTSTTLRSPVSGDTRFSREASGDSTASSLRASPANFVRRIHPENFSYALVPRLFRGKTCSPFSGPGTCTPVARPNRHYVPSWAKNDSQCGCQELGPSNSEGCASPSGIRQGGKDRSPVRQAVIRRRVLVFTGRRATRNATVARRKSAAIMRGSGSQNTGIRLRSGTSATTIVCTTTRKMTVG